MDVNEPFRLSFFENYRISRQRIVRLPCTEHLGEVPSTKNFINNLDPSHLSILFRKKRFYNCL